MNWKIRNPCGKSCPPARPLAILAFLSPFVLSSVVLPVPTRAENPILEALEAAPARSPDDETIPSTTSSDPRQAIENALAEARRRHAALLRQSGEDASDRAPSTALDLSARLLRILEQRLEARTRADDLALGRQAIESALARDPSELFGVPPPFPVPILDGVLESWRREADQEAQQRIVLEDRKANLRLAEETKLDLEKERRRLRDVLHKEHDEVERVRLETALRALDDRLRIATEEVALARQRVANATIEHEIKRIATRQARAALAWVEGHLAPRETDLAEAIERLDRDRFELERSLERARTRLASSQDALRRVEERDGRNPSRAASDPERELEARRNELSFRQHIVALLNQRIERLGRMRTSWQRRYAVLGDRLDLGEAPEWQDAVENELDRLTRLRRIHETEVAELRLKLTGLLGEAAKADRTERMPHWRKREIEALQTLVDLYRSDLDSLDGAIALEERLRAELAARLEDRNLEERVRGLADEVRSFWSFELTTSGDRPITPGKILIAITVFGLGYLFARFLMRVLARRFFPKLGFDAGASNAFASLTFYGLLAAAFLFALRTVNIPLTAFAVVGGALALGIGFGSQAIVSNFISGLLLLAERPIRTGDLVEIGGVIGNVETIGLRSTRIRTADNFHIIVPNASFLETNVINWTHQDPRMRLRVAIGVAYGSPAREVERLLVEAASSHPRTLDRPAPAAYFIDFGDSALLFEIRFWIRYDDGTDRAAILSDIRFRIDELFAANDIVIAFPQMDVHLHAMNPNGSTDQGERRDG